tara:strand:+ start:1585 stop:1833 length:249 start_codon:yes stop_codon:yes gene_type:complete
MKLKEEYRGDSLSSKMLDNLQLVKTIANTIQLYKQIKILLPKLYKELGLESGDHPYRPFKTEYHFIVYTRQGEEIFLNYKLG